MKKQIYIVAFSTLLGVTAAIGAPQDNSASAAQTQPAPSVQAQPNSSRMADPGRQARRLAKRLQLTADQQNQLLPILQQNQQNRQNVLNDTSLSATDRRAKLRDLRQSNQSDVRNLLTDSQKQQYDQMLQNARAHARAKRHQANAAPANS